MLKQWYWIVLEDLTEFSTTFKTLATSLPELFRTWAIQPEELVVDMSGAKLATAGESEQGALLARWVLDGASAASVPRGRPIPNRPPEYGPADQLVTALGFARRFHAPDLPRTPQREYDSYRARWDHALDMAADRNAKLAEPLDLRAIARRELLAWAVGLADPLTTRASAPG